MLDPDHQGFDPSMRCMDMAHGHAERGIGCTPSVHAHAWELLLAHSACKDAQSNDAHLPEALKYHAGGSCLVLDDAGITHKTRHQERARRRGWWWRVRHAGVCCFLLRQRSQMGTAADQQSSTAMQALR